MLPSGSSNLKMIYFYIVNVLLLLIFNSDYFSLYIFRKICMKEMNMISFLLSKENDFQIIFPSIF